MRRDFSEANQQQLLSTISTIEKVQLSEFSKFVGFNGLMSYRWVGLLDLNQYLKTVDNYNGAVQEVNHISKAAICRVFEDAREVDRQRSISLQQTKHHYNILKDYLKELADVMDVRLAPFTDDNGHPPIFNTEIIEKEQLFIVNDKGKIELDLIKIKELFEKTELVDEDYEKLLTLIHIISLSDTRKDLHQQLVDAGFNDEKKKKLLEYMQKNLAETTGGTPIRLANGDITYGSLDDLYNSTYLNGVYQPNYVNVKDRAKSLNLPQFIYEIFKKGKLPEIKVLSPWLDKFFSISDIIEGGSSLVEEVIHLYDAKNDPNSSWQDFADAGLGIIGESLGLADSIIVNAVLSKVAPGNQIGAVKGSKEASWQVTISLTEIGISFTRGMIRQSEKSLADGFQPVDIAEILNGGAWNGLSKTVDQGTKGAIEFDGDDSTEYGLNIIKKYKEDNNIAFVALQNAVDEGNLIEKIIMEPYVTLQVFGDTLIHIAKKAVKPQSVFNGGFR